MYCEEKNEDERIEPISGQTIGWWKNLRGTCCVVGIVLSVLLGVISYRLDQVGKPKKGQTQFEQPRVYVNEKGNLVHRKCDSSGSALSAVVTIAGLLIAWGYIWWLRFLIKERIKGETWWLDENWPDINKKLANGYEVFEFIVLYGALTSADYVYGWHLAWCWRIIIFIASYFVVVKLTGLLLGPIIRGRIRMTMIEIRAMYEIEGEEKYKAGMPFRVKRYYCLTDDQEMVVLGHYAAFDEAKDRMVEAIETACKQEQGLSISGEEVRKRISEDQRECFYQMRDADGTITSVFKLLKPSNG